MTANHKAPIRAKNNIIPMRATVAETGAVMNLELPAPRSRKRKITGYYMLAPDAWRRLRVSDLERDIIHLVLQNQRNGMAPITQGKMAEELGSTEQYIHRRLGMLQKRHIIYREGQGWYRVNSHIGYQGPSAAWDSMRMTDREPDWNGLRPKLEVL